MIRSRFLFVSSSILLTLLPYSCSNQNGDVSQEARTNTRQAPLLANETRASGEISSIYGKVIYRGDPPRRNKIILVKDSDVCSIVDQYDQGLLVSQKGGIQNAVVFLTGVKGGKPLSLLGDKFIIDQQGCRYEPHVLLLPVNTTLEILNNDGILHNFHTYCKKNQPVNMSQPKFRTKMELSFENPEFVRVRCDIHGWMNGWIISVDHPYYTVSDKDGNFFIGDVPPGTYTLTCWQEKLGERTTEVTVEKGRTVSSTFSFNEAGT